MSLECFSVFGKYPRAYLTQSLLQAPSSQETSVSPGCSIVWCVPSWVLMRRPGDNISKRFQVKDSLSIATVCASYLDKCENPAVILYWPKQTTAFSSSIHHCFWKVTIWFSSPDRPQAFCLTVCWIFSLIHNNVTKIRLILGRSPWARNVSFQYLSFRPFHARWVMLDFNF